MMVNILASARRGCELILHLSGIVRMEPEFYGRDTLRIGCGEEDFALVVLQRLDPAGEVSPQ